MDQMQYRAVPGSTLELVRGDITDIDARSHEVKVEFPHEQVDSFRTTFGPEAFRESFAQRLPVMAWQHDIRDPIGRAKSAQVLRTKNELIGRFSDLDKVPNAARAFAQIDDGTITDFSFGYTDGHERRHPDPQLARRGVKQIPKARMREFSPVSIGSIPGAMATGIREEGSTLILTPTEIIEAVRAEIMTPEAGRVMMATEYPELRDHIVVNTRAQLDAPDADETGGDNGVGASPSECAELAEESSEMAKRAMASGDSKTAARHAAHAQIHARNAAVGAKATSQADMDNLERARKAASDAENVSQRSAVWNADSEPLTTDHVIAAVASVDPVMARALEENNIAIAPAATEILFRAEDGTVTGTTGTAVLDYGPETSSEEVHGLASNVQGALDTAQQWLDGEDLTTLPDNVQQALALVSAASTASDALVDVMGITAEAEAILAGEVAPEAAAEGGEGGDAGGEGGDRADASGWSIGAWDPKEGDYSPEQWRSACLIDTGEGDPDDKGRYKLPVKEPDGNYNKRGIAAASGRLNQTDAPQAQKTKAARALMSLHGKMGKPAPPAVMKAVSAGARAEQEEVGRERTHAQQLLERRLGS